MAGVTDVPFRKICQTYGAGLTTSEMLTAKSELWDSAKSKSRLQSLESNIPNSIQIVGSETYQLADAARRCQDLGADIVDINMGCPAKKVCKKAAGSALLRDEALVESLIKATVNAVDIPVTLKIRTGWDNDNKNAINVAKIAEDNGIQALAIHGRTRACRFNGNAEYDTIAAVKQQINIPLIANGDIDSVEKAIYVKEYTQADAIMIGRAAQGRPWLIQQISQALESNAYSAKDIIEPSMAEKQQCITDHLKHLHAFYGEFTGIRIARKHVSSYLEHMGFSRENRKQFNTLGSVNQQLQFINQLFDNALKGKAA